MVALPMAVERRPDTTKIQDLMWYDHIIVSLSGGKDSWALALGLREKGVPAEKIICWHQKIDGEDSPFMDWPCTESYCRAVTKALGMPLYFQWRHGGFEREMLKENGKIAPVSFERVDGTIGTAGGVKGKVSTRRMFPQVTADLSKRWCSSALKIDVAGMALNNDPAYKSGKILFLTGERRQESSARSKYAEAEQHRCHTKKRHVDHWRMVIDWSEHRVWELMRKYNVNPHPAYRLGWGRVSCLACIFGQADQWASVRKIAPQTFDRIACYEQEFGKTIHQGKTVVQLANAGTPYPNCWDAQLVGLAMGEEYPERLALTPPDEWVLPQGAYQHCGGPT